MDDDDQNATPMVSTVNPKPDSDQYRQEQSQDEDDPDGIESPDIDEELKKTGQAENLGDDEMDTEEVDKPLQRVNQNSQEE